MNQAPSTKHTRIAIASSGLGHVARGVETWARDTADALHERGVDVTLFSGAPLPARATEAPRVAVSCIRRGSFLSRLIVRMLPGYSWRWGLKSGYGLEQLTFWLNLRRLLKCGNFDILHVQDPMVALWCRRARMAGRMTTKEVLAHGTEEPAEFLGGFPYVQHLAPYHMEEALSELGWKEAPAGWCAIPNFVDTERFCRLSDLNRERSEGSSRGIEQKVTKTTKGEIRRRLGIPEDAFVVLSVAAIKKTHKRVDYLIREFASFSSTFDFRLSTFDFSSPHLVIAGARETETDDLLALADEMLGDQAKLMCNLTRDRMPDVFRAADVFVLCSLKEMMPIALIEAMSSGLPALVNAYPVLEWMTGPGGMALDMRGPGNLAGVLETLMGDAGRIATMGGMARQHAVQMFSKDAVIQEYIEYYERVLQDKNLNRR